MSKDKNKASEETKSTRGCSSWEVELKMERNEPKAKKVGLGCAGLLALTYTVVMAVFFSAHRSAASDAGDEYLCVNDDI
jgi:hypothetical protein